VRLIVKRQSLSANERKKNGRHRACTGGVFSNHIADIYICRCGHESGGTGQACRRTAAAANSRRGEMGKCNIS
jgi:hypothetical protein